MSFSRKSGAASRGSTGSNKVRKRSRDVYPDPEPDDLTELLPSTHMDHIAAKLKKVAQNRPIKAFLDDSGRLVDENGTLLEPETGKGKNDTRRQPPKKEEIEPGLYDKPKSAYFDESLVHMKGKDRKRMIFGETGKYTEQGEKMRKLMDARKEFKEKRKAADADLKMSAPQIQPSETAVVLTEEQLQSDITDVPDTEWWDASILLTKSYSDVRDDLTSDALQWRLKFKVLTHYIEHPVPIEGPNSAAAPEPQALILTKKEAKKIRTRTRVEREKDKQEQIAMGLLAPPPPKVKISNIMKVMGKEAVQDPTTIERFVRTQMAERMGRHEARNQERKLDPDAKRRKIIGKMTREANEDPVSSIYRINALHSARAIWKIIENAKQLHLTGMLIRTNGVNLVMIDGGRKPTRKFSRLLLHRIDYELAENEDNKNNACCVWQGYSERKMQKEFKSLTFTDGLKAKKYLDTLGSGHYWDMAVSGREQKVEDDCDELV
eukprot:TRINITY_DN10581_c0_g1_i2.p1 TRINITY_DN10581_c0_g1~~TRINITY_DN10581_c0_g1_i2.p1  ORF type:complete len:504 (+),score=137.71 TRINITY_DN10581_c0_g1_i2:41-1513(+)